MAWSGLFRGWFRGSNAPCADDAEQEIDEELMFHLRSLVDDELAKGKTFDAARNRAHGRFGSQRRYAAGCRGVVFKNHRLVQTYLILLLAFLGVLTVCSLVVVRSL